MALAKYGIAEVKRPDAIDDILNADPEVLAAISDLDTANAVQATLAQYMAWLRQQMGLVKAEIDELKSEFDLKMGLEVNKVTPKSLTLAEKRAVALSNSVDLILLNERLVEAEKKYALLESSTEDLPHLIEVVKQVYYRLRLQTYAK